MSEYPHHDFHGSHPSPRSAHYTAYQYGMRRRGFFRGRLLPFGLGILVGYWWIGRHERHASCQRPKEVTYRRDDHPAMPVPDRPFERDVLARTVEPPQEFGSQISDKAMDMAEAKLDTVLSAIQSLKEKLASQREDIRKGRGQP